MIYREMMKMENKRAWIYCRTAYPDAHALVMQQKHLEAFAEEQGFEIVGTTAEHASGLNLSRRRLAEVFGAVDAGEVDLLLVTDLSRLSRDVEKADGYLRWLKDRSVEVVCADGTVPQTSTEILHQLMKASGVPFTSVE